MDPGTREPEELITEVSLEEESSENKEKQPVPVYAELAEETPAELEGEDMHMLALAYAKYLAGQGLAPGDATFADADQLIAAEQENTEPEKKKTKKVKKARGDSDIFRTPEISDEEARNIGLALGKASGRLSKAAAPIDLYDRVQESIMEGAVGLSKEFITGTHKIISTYRQSRRVIGIAMLAIGVMAAIVLAVFDTFTVYEYSYNGKILGYVSNQDDVIDVLEVAGKKLTENSSGGTEIRFVPNQNIMFNIIDAKGKSIDDADMVVNKLVYMTDIETEAYGVYDGDDLVAVVKSQEDAEALLNDAMRILSTPDEGMKLVSAEFSNTLDIRPVNVLLKSIQSNSDARKTMTEGGSLEIYHIVEQDENLVSLSRTFGIEPVNIYNETNTEVITAVEQGDKICVHEEIEPVQVRMVETGRMKEVEEYETIKKESAEYYKGDTHIQQEGVNGVQIFEGTITKVGGEVVDRETDNIEVITEKKDKIILVGTAERPKTAPTGTFIVPLHNYEGISSPFGYRWGRLHSGIDMGASRGTPIYASDGGTVKMAGWYYGYGLCVDIDHGNGRVTRYGHCSKLLVNAGDQVYQGQNIALVGNTGHSYGNHLHFEVQINGSPVNPRPYIGI